MTVCPVCHEQKALHVSVRTVGDNQPAQWRHECKRCGSTWEGEPGSEPQHLQTRTRHQIHAVASAGVGRAQ